MNRCLLLPCATFLAVTLIGCGGSSRTSGPPGSGNTSPPASQFQVTTSVTGSGTVSPSEQTLGEGEEASIELMPDEGFRIGEISGCGGELQGSDYVTAPLSADCDVSISFIQGGGVSGTLQAPPDIAVDGTLNDRASNLKPNSECAQAQDIDSRGTLHGFAAADGTGGDPEEEHFAEQGDTSDFYRTYLGVGQVMQLEVSDYSAGSQDLSLHLWNADCSRPIDSSDSGEMEEVSSLFGGNRVIEVRAKAGASKYVLRGSTAWSSSDADEDSLLAFSDAMPDFVPYEVIVSFEPDAGSSPHNALRSALAQALGLELNFRSENQDRASLATIREPGGNLPILDDALPSVMETLRGINQRAFDRINTQRIIDFLAQQPGVRYAEPNFIVETQQTNEPNDPGYSSQWHYTQIELPAAWDLITVEESGQDVVVAVLDTGVYLDHDDLRSYVLSDGWDFHDGDNNPDETSGASNWHGTHVAGTIGAATDNGIGVAGVSWGAKILPIRVLGEEGGSRYNVMQGVRYAAGLPNDSEVFPASPAQVINLSLGGSGHTRSEQNLYNEVRDQGIVVVAAAGNDSSEQPFYPASYDGVLSVSATNCNNELASYSNFGPTISLAAPGGDSGTCGGGLISSVAGTVLSTVGQGSDDSRSSAYGGLGGTSMAAPHVSGVLALMFAQYPALTPMDVDNLLVNGELTEGDEEGRNNDFGYGEINARKAVQAAIALDEGSGDAFPARVVANPSTLFMEQDDEATLELRRQGEGEAPAVVSFSAEADWLTVAEEDVDGRGLGDYRVTVDRSRFSDDETGRFQSELMFTLENNSELLVEVNILVGSASATAPIYVVLLDPETDEVVHEVLAERTEGGELRFEFTDVLPGDYRLMAGSDIDANGLICQPGEMCGAFPSYEERETLTIDDQMLEERDFVIDILSGFRPLQEEPPQIFRLRE